MSGVEADCLFVILEEFYDPDRGYPLATIWPQCKGIWETDFYCGHDLELAKEFAQELNDGRGHNLSFVTSAYKIRSGLSVIKFFNA